ncbi:MAG TPA: hypothetical protein VIP29_06100 [Nitrososphaeraceae archaeon]
MVGVLVTPVVAFNAVSAQELPAQKANQSISVDKYFNEILKNKKNVQTIVVTNDSVIVDPEKNTVTVGNQTLRTMGSTTTTQDCIGAYWIHIHSDGTASCGVENICEGQSQPVDCL